jgi:acetate kinase
MATILVSNPGSASRKYAVYDDGNFKLRVHYEREADNFVGTVENQQHQKKHANITSLNQAAGELPRLLSEHNLPSPDAIALRIVAPSSYFLQHRQIDGEALNHLRAQLPRAPLHIGASLHELEELQKQWSGVPVLGISDSAFHASKPDYAWNYGIRLEDADRLEIKRFGYHGLSAQSVVRQLQSVDRLPKKLIICHLGSGGSIMAVVNGRSVEASMGFSPLEGLVMSTRSGSIDTIAVRALQDSLQLNDAAMDSYLNNQSGLAGLSGSSSDIRELLAKEADGDYRAALALNTYVHRVQQFVGGMAAVMGGCDGLVFTGAVGERSAPIRQRIVNKLRFLELELNFKTNSELTSRQPELKAIHTLRRRPIYILPTQEEYEMAAAASSLLG